MNTPIETQASILSELWMTYRDRVAFADIIEYGDLGLPLAYAIHEQIVKTTPRADEFISEVFDLLLASCNLEDTGFETLDDIILSMDV